MIIYSISKKDKKELKKLNKEYHNGCVFVFGEDGILRVRFNNWNWTKETTYTCDEEIKVDKQDNIIISENDYLFDFILDGKYISVYEDNLPDIVMTNKKGDCNYKLKTFIITHSNGKNLRQDSIVIK